MIVAAIYLTPLLGLNLVYPAIIAIVMTLSLTVLIYSKDRLRGISADFLGIIYLGGLCGYLIMLRHLRKG